MVKIRDLKIPKPVGFIIMIAIIFFGLGYAIPWTIVLGKAGLLSPAVADSLQIYSNILLFVIGIILLWFANYFWKRNNQYGDNIGIFNKESTIFKNFTYPQLGLLGMIIFASTFLFLNLFKALGKGFFAFKVVPQQFSPTDILTVSTFQIPIAEESLAFFTLGLFILILTIFAIKYKWKKENFNVTKYAVAFFGLGIFGMIWHSTVYGNSDVSLYVTGLFWGIKALLGLFTGFILIPIEFHAFNNFFIDFSRLYTSSYLFGFVGTLILVLIVIYYFLYRERGLFPFRRV